MATGRLHADFALLNLKPRILSPVMSGRAPVMTRV